jgi:hypothetical protein
MSNEIFHGNLLDRLKKEGIEEAMASEQSGVNVEGRRLKSIKWLIFPIEKKVFPEKGLKKIVCMVKM